MKEEKNGVDKSYLTPDLKSKEDAVENKEKDISLKPQKDTKAHRIGEILELREENRKVFRMSDGTEQAVYYPEPVHAFNKDTKTFDDVDVTLVEDKEGKHFVNKQSRFAASFSKEENDELFSIESGEHRVIVSSVEDTKSKRKGKKGKLHKRFVNGPKKSDCIVFEDLKDGADYEYCVTGNAVKENIIVKEKSNDYRYSFNIRMENVSAKFDEETNKICFISDESKNTVFFIPEPFMIDNNGEISSAVSYEIKNISNNNMTLDVVADSSWINDEKRAFPVTIDPQIKVAGPSSLTTYTWVQGDAYPSDLSKIGLDGSNNINRMYMAVNIPTLPRNPRIKKAELKLYQTNAVNITDDINIGIYQVENSIFEGPYESVYDSGLIDYAKIINSHADSEEDIVYSFDITTLVDLMSDESNTTFNLVLKLINENIESNNYTTFYGSSNFGDYKPELVITYESSYGVNTSYRTHTHELGRFGQGSVDLQCGNLMFESEDFAWAGNRMPVTIKHLYNSALSGIQYDSNDNIKLYTAEFAGMKLGYGFKLNVMQSMRGITFQHEGEIYTGYVYIGENGEESYFKESQKCVCNDDNTHCYNLYENVTDEEMLYDPERQILTIGDDKYTFNNCRLVSVTDKYENSMRINYDYDQIHTIVDGAGREFAFSYDVDGTLSTITAPDNTQVKYTYNDGNLVSIEYPENKNVTIAYESDKPSSVTLLDGNENIYKVKYVFNGDRLKKVTEYGVQENNFVMGVCSEYTYSAASNNTVVVTTEQADDGVPENVVRTVYTFNDDGEIVSEYVYSKDTGNVAITDGESGIHPHSGENGAAVVSNINNLLKDHNFESMSNWTAMSGNLTTFTLQENVSSYNVNYGYKTIRMRSINNECTQNGIYQTVDALPAGQYTFSAYLKSNTNFTGNAAGAYIRVRDENNNILAVSERLSKYDTEFTRLIAPFELASQVDVKVEILIDGKGSVYVDAAQLENNQFANAYNILENGNFELDSGWTLSSGSCYTTEKCFNMSRSLKLTGELDSERYAMQTVPVRKSTSTRETFILSGWAKGCGLPNHEREGLNTPTIRLRAVINYNGGTTEEHTADFTPCTEEWQLASVEFSKSKYLAVENITVYCEYSYNNGDVFFDDIQLVRNSIETNLTSSDFETVDEEETVSTETETETTEETTDTTATEFEEIVDDYGNTLTETTFTDGEFGTIYRSFKFNYDGDNISGNDAGNNLIEETDARGFKTTYDVEDETSRNKEVVDRLGNKTVYEYDEAGRTTSVTNFDSDDDEIASVSYAYDAFDNMTEIVRGDGLKYVLNYNAFHNLESIGVDGKAEELVHYTYKSGNGRLKEIAYANGDVMKATYNSIGQMVSEKWYSACECVVAHYKYVYDGQGNIVRSIDICASKEYNYVYENDFLARAIEYDITLDGEAVTSKTVVNAIKYYYDSEGEMTKKVITPTGGASQTIYYENTEDNTVVKFSAGGKMVTSHSKNDSFGRKVFDELQLGTGFVSRQFQYLPGEDTDTHVDNGKLKSSPTTQLVSQITFSDETTLSYSYDAEERITSVVKITKVNGQVFTTSTLYTYDALGQLETETVDGVTTKYVYDNYGNIKAKGVTDESGEIVEATKITYAYDTTWKDLLTSYNGQSITYDAQGNPTSYLGHTLTWEKGRQLKSFDSKTYTYNANGIRTSKTVNGVKHTYTLDGTKILRETWGNNSLVPLYDNEDSVCGILYNNTPYYFQKNLQGDVIGIVDKDTTIIARYTYDAWGKVVSIRNGNNNAEVSSDATHIANINPFRYRGYYYDAETGLYYVSSRYYDPEIGRWINSDEMIMLTITNDIVLGLNLSSYVFNDPVNQKDSTGFIAHVIIGAITGALISALSYFVEYWLGMRNLNWWAFAGIVATAAALGAIGGYISGWVKFVKLAKHARLPKLLKKLKSPIVRNIVTWAVRGIKFVINSFVKKLSRKPGESWVKAIRRWLNI